MPSTKRIVFVAGEESGDLHAASIVRQLKSHNPDLIVSGIGGQHMESAGVELISDLARFGVTGLTEVLRHISVIKSAFKAIKAHLVNTKPDLLILVDYPGFNLRLAKYAKQALGIRIIYYISPQIWAWKAGRIHAIRQYIDRMAVIFPFEKKIYENAGVPVTYVGNPLLEKINSYRLHDSNRNLLGLPENKCLIAMLPGSRRHEIEKHMPVLVQCAEQLHATNPNLHVVIPIASTITTDLVTQYFKHSSVPYTLKQGHAIEIASVSDCIVVASGTASLECALLEKPMCIIYKASLFTYIVASKLVKIKYLGLCNLLQNKMIVPELLQYDCNPDALTSVVSSLLNNQHFSHSITKKLHSLKQSLSLQSADCSIQQLIENELKVQY